ncbi:hypothetical protein HDF26_000950 [Pedobacter cryoconitis]|uniref:hypothetical protein n=1 Tax=Pedobacter cryoconitis TaxID=188932 RepID=UPI00160ED2EE|nr:hypothetical protein [Pedobacter cryoconitis]MBB6270523.1 hypothetical protein [Pedobacter cryoconitis]
MVKKLPIHLLKGLIKLTPEQLEKHLKEQEEKFFDLGKWNSESHSSVIFIDLSQIRWVNISAATILLIIQLIFYGNP